MLSLRRDLVAGRPLVVDPELGGLGGYLLAWAAPLAFCSGLCGLAVSSVFEAAVPRWFILGYGSGCALLALLAPLLSRSWQQLQTAGLSDRGSLPGEGATAFWATGKGSMARFSGSDAKPAAVRLADRAAIVAPGKRERRTQSLSIPDSLSPGGPGNAGAPGAPSP